MEQNNQEQTGIGKGIGRHKYEFLKQIPKTELTDLQRHQIVEYENRAAPMTAEQIAANKEYFKRIREKSDDDVKEVKITAEQLYKVFKSDFFEVNKREYVHNDETKRNLQPIIFYLTKDDRFFQCQNLRKDLSEPSFLKGLLVIGNFGNGKSAAFKTLAHVLRQVKGFSFKTYTANQVVGMFEQCADESERREFERIMYGGRVYFDDVKTERIASKFGKVNVFKDIIEERYNNKALTYITCNFAEGFPGDTQKALDEFEFKYGGRVYDRLFEMFNIVEFHGKSFRK